ncbi:MAG TPA: PAS domain S-box protein [Acetobacteraceae bacterium]|nr:PAS domain S-box protein [Acetobacteraceae bacterium]
MLQVTEAHLRTVLDSIPAPIALVDNKGRHCYVNEAYRAQVGQPVDKILGRTIEAIVGRANFKRMRPTDTQQPLMDRARTGETVHWEGWLGYPDGERYVQRLYFPYRNEDGLVEGVFAFSRDVSDLKRSQEMLTDQLQQLQLAHGHLRAVMDSMPSRVALLDRDERHRYANREYCEFVALPIEKLIGMTRAQVIGKSAAAAVRPYAKRALAGETVRVVGWITYRQGRRYIERVNLPHRNEDGEIDGYFNFTRDLTELKLSEEQGATHRIELLGSEARNAAITASALDCIIAIDEDGRVVEWNPAAEETFGYSRDEALGQRVGDIIVPPGTRAEHELGMARYMLTGESRMIGRRVEVEAMRRDGTLFPAELAMSVVELPQRRLFTAYLRDLTAVRQAEDEIRRQREALHQVEKMAAFGSLLAGVAHELNNPLSIIIGNAMMLAEDAEQQAPALVDRAGRIQAAAERCGRITHSFLKMARAQKPQMRRATAGELVDTALQLLNYGMRSSGITVERRIPPTLPAVLCDADQINQVLTNMLVNARQELEQQPQPRLLRISARSALGALELEVADNGPGVSPAIASRVFDPFFTTKPAGTGTGIGLTVSRGIAEVHGGSLTMKESPLGGACFVLRLPALPAGLGEAEAEPAETGIEAKPPGRRALIVDDEAEVAQVLSDMLRPHGFNCDIVTSGELAKRRLSREAFDLVLCDLRMPGIDGPALFAWMEAAAPHHCRHTAFVTGDTLGHAAGAFLARSGRPVLEKPFGPATLRRLLGELGPA